MTILDMLRQSGLLTLLGMGVVFSFIIIMIFSMHLLHAVLHALHIDVDEKKDSAKVGQVSQAQTQQVSSQTDNSVIAAIAAFFHKG